MSLEELLFELKCSACSLRCCADNHMASSNHGRKFNDLYGAAYHDGASCAYDVAYQALSALLDKAESGR